MFLILLLIISTIYVFYKKNYKFDYWEKRGVPNPKTIPFLGNLKTLLFQQESPAEYFDRIYKQYSDDPYVGIYKINQPALFLRDPDLIKEAVIKDFSSFHDNDLHVTESDLFSQNPFLLKADKWKTARAQITSSFTTTKLKGMFDPIEQVGNRFVGYIENEGIGKDIETQGLQPIISLPLGISGNSFDKPGNSDLLILATLSSSNVIWTRFKSFCLYLKPAWAKIIQPKYFSKQLHDYFTRISKDMLKHRAANNIVRNDFFDSVHEFSSRFVEEYQLAVHLATVNIDGVETSALTMAFVLYDLAKNTEIQNKLREKIQEMLEQNNEKWSYDGLMSMEYLDCVISESLRLHPPLPFMTRICNKQFTFPITERNSRELTVEVGTPIIVPVTSLHYDGQYYPNPTEFDPGRFKEGTKLDNPKCTYMPFGEGPRICIGRRYAQLQLKIGIAKIVSKFKIRVSNKTIDSLQMEKIFFLMPIDGIWLNFEKLLECRI